ncbi:MAG: amidohydrolase [Anaerolineales bacterium]|nr:amidohydrolase [Anaerolineales bacterium]
MKILYNAKIYTLDKTQPTASALAIEHGQVIAVGGDKLTRELDGVEKEDMRGRIILPGLTDAHLHLKLYSMGLQKIDCETNTLEECLTRVAERAQKTKPGEWIFGHGWNQNSWDRWPSASDLDTIAPNNPVYLTAKSLHAALANSIALKMTNINASTPDPKDGQIQRDQNGQATGVLLETAMQLVEDILPVPTVNEIANAIENAQPGLWKMGLTGLHDFDYRDCFMALQQLHAQNKLKLRVTKNIPLDLLEHALGLGLQTGFGDDWLRIGSVKVFMDGALGPHTAAMFQPYSNESENRGILNMDSEQLFEHARHAAHVGLGMTVHAIGDRANHEVLDAYERLRAYETEKGLPHLRHRIEHVQLLHPDDAQRLAKLNIVASMQPVHATSDMLMADAFWGERSRLAYAWRTQLDVGTQLAFGSDAPVESPNPFLGLHAAVTRRRGDGSPKPDGWYPEQRLTIQEAVAGFTVGPAYAAYAENRMGKLQAGYLADLIVLEEDPFICNIDDVKDMQTSAAMINGEWVWRS